ncbi:MAG: enoyl-CoA hydratase-related protein [Acidaminococcaceae bacterium]|nr:enoyl-CoA hydratase-related protein [Acidaminococcaceae bacterium]
MEKAVLYQKKEAVAWITLNRPQSLNSMNDILVEELHAALDEAAADEGIRSIIITGAGKAFCAGGDLTYLETLESVTAKKAFIEKVGLLARKITKLPKAVIAMVNGVAAGAGANLMLACDLVFAVESARFAQSFVKVGLVPDCGGMYFLPKAVGLHKAKELMFTGDMLSAGDAQKLGMVNRLYNNEELVVKTEEMALRLASSPPLSIELSKATLNRTDLELDDVLAVEASVQTLLLGTKDCAEGITAFKEKRSPVFLGC